MRPVSFMRHKVTFLVRADAAVDAYGAVREGFTTGDTVWASFHTPTERTRRRWERYDSPVDASVTLAPHSQCVAGNRLVLGGVTYEILGVDTTSTEQVTADIRQVL